MQTPHSPSLTANCNPFLVQRAVSLRPPRHSCGNRCFHKHKGSQTAENLKRLVVCLAFCCCCFCFYCRGIHGGLMNRGPVSDGLWCPRCFPGCTSRYGAILGIARTLRNSAASRPPDVWVCFYPTSTLLFSQRATITTAVLACCLYVCV